eukprot:11757-Eustigmatos_ZCMA.PRE.1
MDSESESSVFETHEDVSNLPKNMGKPLARTCGDRVGRQRPAFNCAFSKQPPPPWNQISNLSSLPGYTCACRT